MDFIVNGSERGFLMIIGFSCRTVLNGVVTLLARGINLMVMIAPTEAMTPVNRNTINMQKKINPIFFIELIRATAHDRLKNISGPIAMKIKLIKRSPSGFNRMVFSPKKYPTKPPKRIEERRSIGKK